MALAKCTKRNERDFSRIESRAMKRDVTKPARHASDRRDLAARGRDASASRCRAHEDAYATSDGRGGIAIGATETLDGDDALAQLVFHELCHAITEGEASLRQPDWGLDNVPEHVVREHACLRLQARLSDRFGLRAVMAPTTPYRDYYAALPRRSAARRGRRRRRGGARGRGVRALRRIGVARADRAGAGGDGGRDRTRGRRRARGAPARLPARSGGGDLRDVRLAVRRRARRRGHALPAERARERRRRAHGARPPGVRALGAGRRLPHLRRLLPRGVSLGHRVDARSGGLAGAGSDRAPRPALRDPPRRRRAARR